MIEQIHWLGHASFRIDGPQIIYIDPFRIGSDQPPADVILVTHEHYDHFSQADILRLMKHDTHLITNQRVASSLDTPVTTTILRPWQSVNIDRLNIKATPAYTHNDAHPQAREDLGFIVAINHHDIYYAGDTDFVPELNNIRCDIAILPVSAREGMMTVEETSAFVRSLKPRYVVPSHYGSPEGGNYLDAKALETAVGDQAEVILLSTAV